MSEILTPDICVIGAGSGGLSTAAIAAAFGVEVVLIEKGEMGGDCLNYGCVPSKAMLAAAKHAANAKQAMQFGVHLPDPVVDYQKVQAHVRSVIDAIAPNDSEERFTALGVHVIKGEGKFISKSTVKVDNVEIKARRFVIATGSSASVPPITGIDKVPYLTNETLFELKTAPDHLIIIGGGPIGMEMAQAHLRLGCKVTVLEAFTPLAKDDPELTEIVLESLTKEGIDIRAGAKINRIEKKGVLINVYLERDDGEEKLTGSHLLVAAGRAPNVEGIGLKKAGIKYKRAIKVSKSLRTTNRRVYAIGDVAGSLQFTHMANYHAGLVIRAILFRLPVREKTTHIPWVTYTDPELSHVGLTEADAKKKRTKINVLRWPYAENDRAQAERKTSGLIKVIVKPNGKILGATIVGMNSGEIINMWALAISKGMKVQDMAGYIAPYPTLSEINKRVAVTHIADGAKGVGVRRLINFLRKFG